KERKAPLPGNVACDVLHKVEMGSDPNTVAYPYARLDPRKKRERIGLRKGRQQLHNILRLDCHCRRTVHGACSDKVGQEIAHLAASGAKIEACHGGIVEESTAFLRRSGQS